MNLPIGATRRVLVFRSLRGAARALAAVLFAAALVAPQLRASSFVLPLAGRWHFELDRADAGQEQRWFERQLAHKIHLPGSLPEQGIGDDITLETKWAGGIVDRSYFTEPQFAPYREAGHVKVPFWLQPTKYYAGPAWFQRDINIPDNWRERRVILFLERPHWETRVLLDGKPCGTNTSLSTPHEYDLGRVAPGEHKLTVRVDNRMVREIGENSHAISDHTQGNWNGIVGRLELRAVPLLSIADIQVYPNAAQKTAHVRVTLSNATDQRVAGRITLSVLEDAKATGHTVSSVSKPFQSDRKQITAELELNLGPHAGTWDEFSPALYRLQADLDGKIVTNEKSSTPGLSFADNRAITFGLRDISTDGTQLTINGRKTFIRGTLECCIFPKTGHPPTAVAEWERIMRVAKSFGLNLLRFHSYCPPEAAFAAADKLGMYLQVETCWANQSTSLGDGKDVDQWVYDETDRILKTYGNHPSFLLMPYGNEPGGKNATSFLSKYVAHYKSLDPRRLWTSGSGWPQIDENQFHITPDPRIQKWGAGLASRINALPPETTTDYRKYVSARSKPVISHEIGQWCAYPNFAEMSKYTGYLKPRNFEIFESLLEANGLRRDAHRFLIASGKLQTLCYKEDIESALRTPGMGGFELLDLHDFPGQGTALVGVLDPFWEEKGYVTATEYRRFCNSTVPLARMKKRVFTVNEPLEAELEIAHFGPQPLEDVVPVWSIITDNSKVLASGKLPSLAVPIGNGSRLGSVSASLRDAAAPVHCKFVVGVQSPNLNGDREHSKLENDWDIWIYPPARSLPLPSEGDVLVTSELDQDAEATLRSGGKVLLTIPGKNVRNFDDAPVKLGFSSIFWNTAWTRRQAPTTLGILCAPEHPALAQFPTEYHSNWQWWYLLHRAGALRLDLLPSNLDPLVRVIDDWFTARPLGLIIEGKVGKGSIIICGFDLTPTTGTTSASSTTTDSSPTPIFDDPVSRQMRESLMNYMVSKKFRPRTSLSLAQVRSLYLLTKPVKVTSDHETDREGTEQQIESAGVPEPQPLSKPNIL